VKKVKKGDIAIIEYEAAVIDAELGEVARERGEMRLRAGDCGAIGGIDREMIGMEIGERKNLEIPPDKAFGPRDPELVMQFPRSCFERYPDLKTGSLLRLFSKKGSEIEVITREVNPETVIVDANYPLAGMSLRFDIRLMAVESP